MGAAPSPPPPPTTDELAERTLELVRISSVTGDEGALADFVEGWARDRFGARRVHRVGHSVAVGELGGEPPELLLAGHLDTVPAHQGDPPPRREGGRVHGLGASDMKGGLAVMMALAERKPLFDGPLRAALLFYEREEAPFDESGLPPLFDALPLLKRAGFAVAMEPTDGAVHVGCVGSLHATLRFVGRRAHSARPWHGVNAIHQAGALLAKLHALPPTEVTVAGLTFREVVSITTAHGGAARNVVPDAFELNLNYRFAPGKSVAEAEADVLALVDGRAEVTITDRAPAGRVCADNPLYTRLLDAVGRPPEAKQAWTDVGRLSEMGIDAVSFGPGETAQAHQANESAPEAPLREAYEALASLF